jgi:glycogen(starch) synthase
MKILMTADTLGGVWRYSLELARGLLPFGAEIALATLGAPLTDDQRDEVAELPNVELFESSYKLVWMDDPWDDLAAAGDWLLRLAHRWKPDLVHLNDYPHGDLSWPAPVLMVGHSCVLSWWQAVRHEPAPPAWNRYRETVAQGLAAAGLVAAPSAAMLAALERFYGPLPPSRVIHNGRRMRVAPEPRKEPLILSAGRVWDQGKNIHALVRAAVGLPWPVYVAGEIRHPSGGVPEFANARFLGQLSAEALAPWFARAAIYALPARYEPFGLSPLEAALAGCALVLGDIPSLREVWGNAAIYVLPDDIRGFRAALLALARDELLRLDYARRARERAGRYTLERMAADYWDAYSELLAPLRPRSAGETSTVLRLRPKTAEFPPKPHRPPEPAQAGLLPETWVQEPGTARPGTGEGNPAGALRERREEALEAAAEPGDGR